MLSGVVVYFSSLALWLLAKMLRSRRLDPFHDPRITFHLSNVSSGRGFKLLQKSETNRNSLTEMMTVRQFGILSCLLVRIDVQGQDSGVCVCVSAAFS